MLSTIAGARWSSIATKALAGRSTVSAAAVVDAGAGRCLVAAEGWALLLNVEASALRCRSTVAAVAVVAWALWCGCGALWCRGFVWGFKSMAVLAAVAKTDITAVTVGTNAVALRLAWVLHVRGD